MTKKIWEKTFLFNRTFVIQNKEKYNTIIEIAALQHVEYLKTVAEITNNQEILNCTFQKLMKSLLYLMFLVTSFYCQKPGLLLKTITKHTVCELIPIFAPIKSGKCYLIIDSQKVDDLVAKLLE